MARNNKAHLTDEENCTKGASVMTAPMRKKMKAEAKDNNERQRRKMVSRRRNFGNTSKTAFVNGQ